MTNRVMMLMIPVVALTAACGGNNEASQMDEALRRDLATAASAQPVVPQQYMSPAELGYMPQPYGQPMPYGYQPQAYGYPQPVAQPQPTRVVYRTAPAPRAASTAAPARTTPPSGTIIQRNTARDAAIGAGVGAVAGAAIKGNTKGALVGAAVGGVVGGVIGHTVDVKRQP